MRGVHFSLRWLFGVVSFLAVGCGLLIYASPFLSKLAFTGAVVVLLAAISAAVYRAGDRRAFWAGFALFGFAYLWMLCGRWQSPDGSSLLRDRLVTSDLLIRCYEALPSSQASSAATVGYAVPGDPVTETDLAVQYYYLSQQTMAVGSVANPGVDRTDFLTTGHALFAIVFALLGGTITRGCSRRIRTR